MSLSFAFTTNILYFKHTGFPRPKIQSQSLRHQCSSCLVDSFDTAVSKGYIKDFGKVIHLDDHGYFPAQNALHLSDDNISLLKPVTNAILRSARLDATSIRSIFVRGSFVSGTFQNDRSDLDLLIISDRTPSESSKRRMRAAALQACQGVLRVCAVDFRYVQTKRRMLGRNALDVLPSVTALLHAYSVRLYGDGLHALGIVEHNVRPGDDLAINIRSDQRFFLRAFQSSDDFGTKLAALQWICKRGLRAVTDICSFETKMHSRDIVPCFKIASKAYPQYKSLFLSALLIACATDSNGFVGLSKQSFETEGIQIALNLVEVVEELSLKKMFGNLENLNLQTYSAVNPTQPHLFSPTKLYQSVVSQIANITSLPKQYRSSQTLFRSSALPKIEISPHRFVEEHAPLALTKTIYSKAGLLSYLSKSNKPKVYRRVLQEHWPETFSQERILNEIVGTQADVQCRVSPTSEVMFCRGDHAWIESNIFSPPSVVKNLSPVEALERMTRNCSLPAIYYTRGGDEVVYMQSELERKLCLFRLEEQEQVEIAQAERIWISTNGTVSSLHYDAAYSALLQRNGSKRMLFFAPNCLEFLGIYPLGHPLHRRSRVNLGNKDSVVFKKFWSHAAPDVIEVVLHEGDLVTFPPFWTHYTESMTSSESELSISHTIRYS